MTRAVLVICRTAPYGNERARDALDVAMAFGAFDQQVALLFVGDGVLTPMRGQEPSALRTRHLGKLIGTLPDYGIAQLHVDARALRERGLAEQDLVMPAVLLDDAQIAALIAAHTIVLSI